MFSSLGSGVDRVCKYHSNPNCFLYIDVQLMQSSNISDQDIIELEYNNKTCRGFFSPMPTSAENNSLYLNCTYAQQLGLKEHDLTSIKQIYRNVPQASSITLEPISMNDWQILELNLNAVQDNLLNQLKCVFINQQLPIWIDRHMCIFVRVSSVEPGGLVEQFCAISGLTKVNIQPVIGSSNKRDDLTASPSSTTGAGRREWTAAVGVDSVDADFVVGECGTTMRGCSALTTVQIGREYLKQLGVDLQGDIKDEEYIIQITPLKSPIQNLNRSDTKTSSLTTTKKFLRSIHSSYSNEYTNSTTKSVHALLRVSKESACALRMPQFLRRQLGLYQLGSKCLVETNMLKLEGTTDLSRTAKKSIKLRTSSTIQSDPDVTSSFIEFIDQNSECLCPIIVSHGMVLELEVNGELVLCEVVLTGTQYMALFPSLILNDLLTIDVECVVEKKSQMRSLPLIATLNCRPVSLSLVDSTWFQANAGEILNHLRAHLYLPGSKPAGIAQPESKPRGLVLHGLKGSGKSTLLKAICNQVHQSTLYYYINCQNFMNKTADTIYDQLRLIYQECSWSGPTPCLVILDNLDLLIENKSHTIDPSSQLYHAQIVESLKELLGWVRDQRDSCCCTRQQARVQTIVSMSCPIGEMPSLFHCLDGHGLFSSFVTMRTHSIREETKEIIEKILASRGVKFSTILTETILNQTDGFVYKDLEKLIDQILLTNWSCQENGDSGKQTITEIDLNDKSDKQRTVEVLYNYTCINMLETQFYKAKSGLSWELVGGLEDVKRELIEALVWPIKYRQFYKRLDMKEGGGVLMYGPSGCGKTLIASALANESKFNFISVKGPELLSKYIGSSEQNVRELFSKAEKAKPCLIFFDEFDSLAPRRGHDSTGVTDRVVNQLLTQLDGVERLDGVYLLAATSRPDLIDQALLRPGRIDRFLHVGYPEQEELKKIFSLYCKEMNLAADVDLDTLSSLCCDFTGADIKSVVCDAMLKAFHRLHPTTNGLIGSNLEAPEDEDHRLKIQIEMDDLLSCAESVRESMNRGERQKLRRMYGNWRENKVFADPVQSRAEISRQQQLRATLA